MPRVFVTTSEDKRDIHQIRSDKKHLLYTRPSMPHCKMLGHLIRDCFANSFESRKKPRSGLADLSHFEDAYRIRSPFFASHGYQGNPRFLVGIQPRADGFVGSQGGAVPWGVRVQEGPTGDIADIRRYLTWLSLCKSRRLLELHINCCFCLRCLELERAFLMFNASSCFTH